MSGLDQERRWGAEARPMRRTEPALRLYVAMLLIGLTFFWSEEVFFSHLENAFLLSWLIVIVYAIPVAFVVYRLDLFEKEPKWMLAAAVVWGGVVAASLAGEANGPWLSVLAKISPDLAVDWGPAIVAPGVEEPLKLLGVVTLFLIARSEFDGVLDGFVYGAMVGLGFTVVEDVGYFMSAALQGLGAGATTTGSQLQPVLDVAAIRLGAGGLYGHVLFTGLTGMGFAYFATQVRETFRKRLVVASLGIGAGILAHALWNSPLMQSVLDTPTGEPSMLQWIEYGTLKGAPFLLFLGLLVVLATRSEQKTFLAIVAGEPDPLIVLESEARSLGSLLSRARARNAAARRKGGDGKRLVGELQKAQVEYALARAKAGCVDDPTVEAVRRRIRAIRAELDALPPHALAIPALDGGVPQAAPRPMPQPSPEPMPQPMPQPTRQPTPQPVVATTPDVVWLPTHLVPPGGIPAWLTPDSTRPPVVVLGEQLALVVESQTGAWAHVRAVNGWRGWVDARRLVGRGRALDGIKIVLRPEAEHEGVREEL